MLVQFSFASSIFILFFASKHLPERPSALKVINVGKTSNFVLHKEIERLSFFIGQQIQGDEHLVFIKLLSIDSE